MRRFKIDIPFLATRVLKISEATLLRETVVRVVLKILQHLSSSTEILRGSIASEYSFG